MPALNAHDISPGAYVDLGTSKYTYIVLLDTMSTARCAHPPSMSIHAFSFAREIWDVDPHRSTTLALVHTEAAAGETRCTMYGCGGGVCGLVCGVRVCKCAGTEV
jgi:hypothetical protein